MAVSDHDHALPQGNARHPDLDSHSTTNISGFLASAVSEANASGREGGLLDRASGEPGVGE